MKVSIKDGSKRKKFPHDLKHSVSTTLDFGFCQPLMSRELCAEDTVNLTIPQFVRLGVVVKPTFGKMSLRTYNKFVPIETVYEPYGSFQAGQQFSHGGHSYIPTEVYNVRICDLWKLCCLHSQVCIFDCRDYAETTDGLVISQPTNQDATVPRDSDEYLTWLFGNLGDGAKSALQTIHSILKWESLIIDDPNDAQLNMDYYDWFVPSFYTGSDRIHKLLICGRFTRAGRNLRSILIGCGHQLNLSSEKPRSILNLIAYYKSYFDLFNPNREKTWKDTHCYRFIERANTNNNMKASQIFYQANDSTLCGNFLTWFLLELPTCYYTYNPDYVSAHITGTALNSSTQVVDVGLSGPGFSVIDGQNNLLGVDSSVGKNANLNRVDISGDGFASVNRSVLRVLDVLSKRINAHTAIGTRIGAYLRSVFGSAYLENDSVDNLGSQSFDIEIDDVMSFAETSEAALGQYAGRGIGAIDADHAEHISFTAPTPGFLVSFICLVPDAGYSQGYDPLLQHVTRRQFFDPDFDAVTLLPNEQINIYGVNELAGFGSYNQSFGNIPVYSEYKIAFNVLNGDMSRNSTRNTFLPFTLDKLLPYLHIGRVSEADNRIRLVCLDSETLVNGEIWRYCNRERWLGNFSRIFLEAGEPFPTNFFDDYNFFMDTEGAEDNFIVHNIVDLKVSSYALPLKDSFDTGSFDGATFDVQKA